MALSRRILPDNAGDAVHPNRRPPEELKWQTTPYLPRKPRMICPGAAAGGVTVNLDTKPAPNNK